MKEEEFQDTVFLATRLSNVIQDGFCAERVEKEYSDTDCYIVSPKGEKTPIQHATSEGEVLRNAKINIRALHKGGSLIVGEVNHFDWISKILELKERKNYSNAKDLVLLLHGSMPAPSAEQIKQMFNNIESSFAGVYYVHNSNTEPSTSYVVALKKYWNTGDIF